MSLPREAIILRPNARRVASVKAVRNEAFIVAFAILEVHPCPMLSLAHRLKSDEILSEINPARFA